MPPKKKTPASKAKLAEKKAKEASPAEEASTADQAPNGELPKDEPATEEKVVGADEDVKDPKMSGAVPEPEEKQETKQDSKAASKKRKAPAPAPREGSRKSTRGGSKSEPNKAQLLNFLLTKDAEDICRPDDEKKDIDSRGKDTRTYTTGVLNPFEELLCAIILSRPISHMLGLRTIRTVLNPPYNFTSAKNVQEAGSEKQHQAVWDARTQHKDKTATQMGLTAEAVLSKFTSDSDKEGSQLGKVTSRDDVNEALEELKKEIKGFGKTGTDIFLRRVQWLWKDAFPYIDGRSADALRNLSLPQNGEELEELINDHWENLDTGNVAGDDEQTKKRRVFVVVLERATGAELENKVNDVLAAASNAA